jgi:hypothetical protein
MSYQCVGCVGNPCLGILGIAYKCSQHSKYINIPFSVLIMSMTTREIIVNDSRDEEFEFDWEPDNKDDFSEVDAHDAFAPLLSHSM